MKPITLLAAFSKGEFQDLCAAIIRSHIAATDLANPMRYTCPVSPIINVTEDSVHLHTIEGFTFNYNIMSHDATPGDKAARIVDHVFLFQSHYFESHPTTQQDCLNLLERTLLGSLDVVFRYISRTDQRSGFQNVDYVFLSNLEFDLASVDYSKWITDKLEARHPNVNFQVGTSVSILGAINSADDVRSRYCQLVKKNSPVIILPSRTGLTAVAFDALGLTRLDDVRDDAPLNVLVKSSVRVHELDKAIKQFNDLLADPHASEEDFHVFFSEHPIFLTGLSYKTVRSKVVLERESAGPLIPDFFMEPASGNIWDILDIKRPTARLWTDKKNRERFSSSVYEVVAQLREYGNYFDDPAHRSLIQTRYGIKCYKPRLVALIGTRSDVDDNALRDAQRDLSSVTIRTYDELMSEVQNIRDWLANV
jgi:hypothetical protein